MSYYDILGVHHNASREEIKRAYREQMKFFHPDVFDGPPEVARIKSTQLNEAYETLKDPEKRRAYDFRLWEEEQKKKEKEEKQRQEEQRREQQEKQEQEEKWKEGESGSIWDVSLKDKLKATRIALCFVMLLSIGLLVENVSLKDGNSENVAASYETGYQAGYEAAQEELKATKKPSQSGTVQSYTYVYVTKSGEKYHRGTCRYAENAEAITLSDAIDKGYTPCSVCNSPRG